MRTATVVVISVSGHRKIYKSGDTVNEEMFPAGRFDELVKGEYIKVISDDHEPVNAPDGEVEITRMAVDDTQEGTKQGENFEKHNRRKPRIIEAEDHAAPRKTEVTRESEAEKEETVGTPDVDKGDQAGTEKEITDTTVIEIRAALDKAGVKYNKNLSKEELYRIFRELKEKKV
jgi:hypothetical protein